MEYVALIYVKFIKRVVGYINILICLCFCEIIFDCYLLVF